MNGNGILSRNIEYKKKLKAFQNIVAIFKILLILGFFVFICSASWICSRCLFISCVIILVFSTRTFRSFDLGIEWVLRGKAMELESLRCIVSHLERVVVVRTTFALYIYIYI